MEYDAEGTIAMAAGLAIALDASRPEWKTYCSHTRHDSSIEPEPHEGCASVLVAASGGPEWIGNGDIVCAHYRGR